MPKKDGLITNFREIPYNPKNKFYAHQMRNNSTESEIVFWNTILKNKKTGYQFNRQKPILHYIIDFYCAKLKLAVEIDGDSHNKKEEYDVNRDLELSSWGIKTIRYNDSLVKNSFNEIEKDFHNQIKIRKKELGLE